MAKRKKRNSNAETEQLRAVALAAIAPYVGAGAKSQQVQKWIAVRLGIVFKAANIRSFDKSKCNKVLKLCKSAAVGEIEGPIELSEKSRRKQIEKIDAALSNAALEKIERARRLIDAAGQDLHGVSGFADEWSALKKLQNEIKAVWNLVNRR